MSAAPGTVPQGRMNVLSSSADIRTSAEDVSHHSASPVTARRSFPQPEGAKPEDQWRVEDGASEAKTTDRDAYMSSVLLENPESETRWYFKYFLGNEHYNYITHLKQDGQSRLVIMSVLHAEDAAPDALDGRQEQTRVILWQSGGSEHLLIPQGKMKEKGMLVDVQRLFHAFGRGEVQRAVEELTDPQVQKQLLLLEEQEGAVNFKIGILPARAGQVADNDMFGNERGSPEFDAFCDLMGSRIELKGFAGYRGGLDVKQGTTGTHSVHTVEFGKEIMFHVSTLLPYTANDDQQLERKRHLGNDICNIVFYEDIESMRLFDPSLIRSKFNHIFAVVARNQRRQYVVKVFTKSTVLEYGPSLPNPAVFVDPKQLRRFLLVKMLNGEKAALASPTSEYGAKKMRTLEALIQSMWDLYSKSDKKKVDSQMVRVRNRNRQTKRNSKLATGSVHDFRAAGQQIKVSKIVDGVAPTSELSHSDAAQRPAREPWLPLCVTSKFPYQIICGDQWGAHLLLVTVAGLFKVSVGAHEPGKLDIVKLVDNAVPFQQIAVDENTGMLALLSAKSLADITNPAKTRAKGSPGLLYAIPLDKLEAVVQPLSKKQLKAYIVPETKGGTLFSLALSSYATTASLLRQTCKMAVALGKKVRVYQFVAKNPGNVPGMGSGGNFLVLEEYGCASEVKTMSVGSGELGTPTHICLGLLNGCFQTINLAGGHGIVLTNDPKIDPIVALDIPSIGSRQEFLLSYNQVSVFREAEGSPTRAFDISWPTRPSGIG